MDKNKEKTCNEENDNLQFVYNDSDTFQNEISEFYNYFERNELLLNAEIYKDFTNDYNITEKWSKLPKETREGFVMSLLNLLDVSNETKRINAAKTILYIAQGCWSEIQTLNEQEEMLKSNVLLLYNLGTFNSFMDLLHYECNNLNNSCITKDLYSLRVILGVLYLITETLRVFGKSPKSNDAKFHKAFIEFKTELDEQILIKLFDMLNDFDINSKPFYPIEKVLLFLWKLMLVVLGDSHDLRTEKNEKRRQNNLSLYEDTIEMSRKVDKKLKWISKVQKTNVNKFLNCVRLKFLGYTLDDDNETLTGLPQTFNQSLQVLNNYMYTPLSEIQINKHELSMKSTDFRQTKDDSNQVVLNTTEGLYQLMLPSMKTYLGSLFKLMQTAFFMSETDFGKTVKNVLIKVASLFDQGKLNQTVLNELEIDQRIRQEIIIKATTAIVLLLLKHFKLNHIYQFEYVSSLIFHAKYLLSVMRFLDENSMNFIRSTNNNNKDFYLKTVQISEDTNQICWRNLFSVINLIRIINKVTKWKDGRVFNLLPMKSARCLLPLLQIKQSTLKLYLLKFYKIRLRYLGKIFKKENMHIYNAIYQTVRHRFNDNWADTQFGGESKKHYDTFEEDLRKEIKKFHCFRYNSNESKEKSDLIESFSTLINELVQNEDLLTETFKNNYQKWLELEVYSNCVEWEKLL